MSIVPVYATSLLSGGVSNGANATGSPDGVWTTDSGNVAWTGTWAMGTPAAALIVGSTQTFKVLARLRPLGQNNPCTYTITVMNGATDIATSGSLTPTEGGVTGTFSVNESQITNSADVRVRIDVTTPGGNPNSRTTAQIDAITWDADIQAVVGDLSATLDDTTASVDGSFPYYGPIAATLEDTAATLSGFHPGPDYAEEYYAEAYYANTTTASTEPSGDLSATLEGVDAAVQATRFPAYWLKIAGTVTIQAGEASFHAILQVDASNNGGWWFDEVRATVNGGANQLTNGLFETGDKTGWTQNTEQDGTVVETGSAFEPPGVYTLQLDADPILPQLQSSDSFPVTEGDEVYVEAWAYFYGGVNSNGKATGRTKNASGDTVRTVLVAETTPAPDVVTGELAATLESTEATANGSHSPTVSATLADTLDETGAQVSAAHGVSATVGADTGDVVAAVSAAHGVEGTFAADTADTQAVSSGVVGAAATITASTADTVAALVGTQAHAADLAATLDSVTADFQAEFGDDPVAVIDATLGDTTAALAATHYVAGSVQSTLESTAASTQASHGVVGNAAATTQDVAASIAAELVTAGTLSAELGRTTAQVAGDHGAAATLTASLDAATASMSAAFGADAAGDLAALLAGTQAQVTGVHGAVATLTASSAATEASAAGSQGVAGSVAATLAGATAGVEATHLTAGSLAATLGATEAAISGTVDQPGASSLSAQLDDTQTSVQAAHGVSGQLVTSAGSLSLQIVAAHGTAGQAAATLEDATAAVVAEYEDSTRTATVDGQLADTQASVAAQHYPQVAGTVVATLDDTAAAVDAEFTASASVELQAQLSDTAADIGTVHGVQGSCTAQLSGTGALFTFKPGSIGEPENPGVVHTGATTGAIRKPVLVGVMDTSKSVGARVTGRYAGVRNNPVAAGVLDTSKSVGVRTTGQVAVVR